MLVRALLLVALAVAGLGDYAVGSQSIGPLGKLDTHLLQVASLRLGHEQPGPVLRWLRSRHAVRSALLGKDGRTVEIRFRDGQEAAILPPGLGSLRLTGGLPGPRLRTLSLPQSPGGRAAVWMPFATELNLPPNAGDPEVNDLQSAGYQVDQAYDTNVTVATMTTLSTYNVVYMHTHSGVGPGGEGLVATGEPANGDPSVAPYLSDGSVVVSTVAGSTQPYYGITTRFILYHEAQFPANSLLFFNGCSLLSGTSFWQALASKGAGVMVSWDGESSVQDNFLAAAAFFGEMTQGMTVAGAISAEEAAGYGTSNVPGQPLAKLGYLGNGGITLQSAQGSPGGSPSPSPTPTQTLPPATSTPQPTPTPRPTSTPTPRPSSTSTPTPTATPVNKTAPPLTVQLESKVSPGARQAITARSTPNIDVHFWVTFPNGDQRTATAVADSAGVARFSFVQPQSVVRHGHVYATVVVQAGSGSAATTHTMRYRIRWGRIDVSVEPREQSAGRTVTIWVHTRTYRMVSVFIWVPGKGRVAQLTGRTGPLGWMHLRFKVRRGLAPSGHTVQVRAHVMLHGRLFGTRTTLTIA